MIYNMFPSEYNCYQKSGHRSWMRSFCFDWFWCVFGFLKFCSQLSLGKFVLTSWYIQEIKYSPKLFLEWRTTKMVYGCNIGSFCSIMHFRINWFNIIPSMPKRKANVPETDIICVCLKILPLQPNKEFSIHIP